VISLIAFEAVQKIDAVFMLEREINGLSPQERLTAPQGHRAAGQRLHRVAQTRALPGARLDFTLAHRGITNAIRRSPQAIRASIEYPIERHCV
jgi:hypothetical protein